MRADKTGRREACALADMTNSNPPALRRRKFSAGLDVSLPALSSNMFVLTESVATQFQKSWAPILHFRSSPIHLRSPRMSLQLEVLVRVRTAAPTAGAGELKQVCFRRSRSLRRAGPLPAAHIERREVRVEGTDRQRERRVPLAAREEQPAGSRPPVELAVPVQLCIGRGGPCDGNEGRVVKRGVAAGVEARAGYVREDGEEDFGR